MLENLTLMSQTAKKPKILSAQMLRPLFLRILCRLILIVSVGRLIDLDEGLNFSSAMGKCSSSNSQNMDDDGAISETTPTGRQIIRPVRNLSDTVR